MYTDEERPGRPGSIWLRKERAGRGPAPVHDRAGITAAAIGLADDGGLDAVTMRKVAAAIGSGATALYRYVERRDELLELMLDAALDELRFPALTGDARADLLAVARELRTVCRRHPWLLDLLQARPPMTPRVAAYLEYALAAMQHVDAPGRAKLEAAATVTGMVAMVVRTELGSAAPTREREAAQAEYLREVVAGGGHPHLAEVVRSSPPGPGDDDLLGRLLPRVLAGLLGGPEPRTPEAR
ncbi:TetR/AcrR family transcriptional regulator [Isoptericola cucumis]|uniref:TetR family transcriptional regulator n=1 Tax=Isoptericola cucumis TaxID=1776856 RepID=A0ABQ2B6Q8_9MICO|nr:TetR/AcrR family transcriptional regulator [Isoptericola cucumis]GGI07641.1 TetR family transcriptional regulator [Isoptericola cucumis]